jgi:hypothetical protein
MTNLDINALQWEFLRWRSRQLNFGELFHFISRGPVNPNRTRWATSTALASSMIASNSSISG